VGANATFGADNEGIGKLSGEIMAKRAGAGAGPVKIGILEGAPEDKFVGPAGKRASLKGLRRAVRSPMSSREGRPNMRKILQCRRLKICSRPIRMLMIFA
jgi:hypothetical protein